MSYSREGPVNRWKIPLWLLVPALPVTTTDSFKMIFRFLYLTCVSVLPAFMCVHHACTQGGKKRTLDPLELELQRHHAGAGIKPGSSVGAIDALKR